MGAYLVWPYFVGMIVLLVLAATPLLAWADGPPTRVSARLETLDGLRGFLALAVFFHHAAVYQAYLKNGVWALPPSRFYADLGQIGVALFFMITGYLFWTQMLKAGGRPNLVRLYIGRVFRIVPLYLLLAAFVLVSVGVITHGRRSEPLGLLVRHVFKWLAGGVLVGGDLNGADAGTIAARVTWTLQYEWVFYASLALTSVIARGRRLGLWAPPAAMAIVAAAQMFHLRAMPLSGALLFLAGMTAASVRSFLGEAGLRAPQGVLSCAVVAGLASVVTLFDGAYGPIQILILAAVFTLVVCGANLFGLLLTRPAKRLGDISYGIYLLQGPLLYLVCAPPRFRAFAAGSALGHWTMVMTAAIGLVLVATLTHVLIERPGVRMGVRIARRLMGVKAPAD